MYWNICSVICRYEAACRYVAGCAGNLLEDLLEAAKKPFYRNHNHRPCRWFALAPLGHDPG